MVDRETYSQIESLEYGVRELNDDFSDLRKDVEQYDDEHRAAVERLTAEVHSLAEALDHLAALVGSGTSGAATPAC